MNGMRAAGSLAETHPGLCLELVDPELAHSLTSGMDRRVEWCCKDCGHLWWSRVSHRARANTGCPCCAGMVVVPGVNDLASCRPDLAMELLDPQDGTRFTYRSSKKVGWVCTGPSCGHQWSARICHREGGSRCPKCSRREAAAKRRPKSIAQRGSLAERNPKLAAELLPPTDPRRVTISMSDYAGWKCADCSHEWNSTISNRGYLGTGCPKCAHYGFDESRPAALYLITGLIAGVQVVQFGISNDLPRRLKEHARTGFTAKPVLVVYGPGREIRSMEREAVREQRERGIGTAKDAGLIFDGATESFIAEGAVSDSFVAWLRETLDIFSKEKGWAA